MPLIIKYKSGETRKVDLTNEFFSSYDVSISKRVLDFAYMHGSDPYYIGVFRGQENVYENNIMKNVPDSIPSKIKKAYHIDEFKIKKALRKEFKNVKFTKKFILHG